MSDDYAGWSPFQLPSHELEKLLARGESESLLRSYFGDDEYAELRELSRRATTSVRALSGPRVLILPGILGSTLGTARPRRNTIWFDPLSIINGEVAKLALDGGTAIEPLDVIPLLYTRLKWRLRAAGFDASYYFYDWRKGLDQLGQELRDHCASLGEVRLVCHSMGGLVARAAIAAGAPQIKQAVLIGTPNAGSFVPVQVFLGTSTSVRQVAALDVRNSSDFLIRRVFGTFPSLHQMLPFADHYRDVDFYTKDNWPADGFRPKRALLKQAAEVQRSLQDPTDSRFRMIAGCNVNTLVGMRRQERDGKVEFLEQWSLRGDGTVPLDLATLPGMTTYYAEETHNGLVGDRRVAEAVRDLLKTGRTDALPGQEPAMREAVREGISPPREPAPVFDGRVGHAITTSEHREILLSLFSPPGEKPRPVWQAPSTWQAGPGQGPPPEAVGGGRRADGAGIGAAEAGRLRGVVIGRRRMHRLDVDLVQGSITDVDARAAVLGVYQNVRPTGPADVFNRLLGNAIDDFVTRRMFTASLGDVFMLPTGTHPVRAETVVFAGLGPFDTFSGSAQQIVADNVMRTLIRAGVDEFATVLFGGNSSEPSNVSLANLVRGFLAALLDADDRHRFRRIVLCELDPDRYEAMKMQLYQLASTPLFDQIELTISEQPPLPTPVAVPPDAARQPRRRWLEDDPVYLTLRWRSLEDRGAEQVALQTTLLTAGRKATVITAQQHFPLSDLKALLDTLRWLSTSEVGKFGRQLAEQVLHPDMLELLRRKEIADRHLVLAHDADSSRIPWEVLNLGSDDQPAFPVLSGGITRKYMAENMSIAKWLESRRLEADLQVLLIVNPTEDLAGAEREGRKIRQALQHVPVIRTTERFGPQATRDTLLADLRSGRFDVVHYAGHAYFNPRQRSLSGIQCAGGEVLTGHDLRDIGNLPALMFFNACESGRVRELRQSDTPPDVEARNAVGFAEAFLRGGVANLIGTYWPVGDHAALLLATEFYGQVLTGKPLGEAILKARRAVHQGNAPDTQGASTKDWADYMVYGDPEFRLKLPG